MRRLRPVLCGLICLFCGLARVSGQRTYAPRSVLADGSWYKISVPAPGVYKIDLPLLNAMGISTASLPSGSIRLFGNGGAMLPEDNATLRQDDLRQNAITVVDGGDGILNGNDYILFYSEGPHTWQYTSGGYRHTFNLYADSVCYFLNIAPGGLRMAQDNATPAPNTQITAYDFHTFYEKDLFNILSGGKRWFGEEFSTDPGGSPERTFNIPVPAAGLTEMNIRFAAAARSTGSSRFDVLVNNTLAQSLYPSPVNGNIFDIYASQVEGWFPASGGANITVKFQQANASAKGWLDYLEVQGRSTLTMPARGALPFRDARSTGVGKTGEFLLTNANAQTQVWDVTDPAQPVSVRTSLTGNTLRFTRDCNVLREYVAFAADDLPKPTFTGPVANQNLHGLGKAEMLIITANGMQAAAAQLAAFHGDQAKVVLMQDIYNEFASGNADPSALRDFVKMQRDRYGLKYLLLFGRASYDYKNRLKDNTNLVPTWQSNISLHGINTYMSDDYFGFLDDTDDINSNPLLDVAIGRLPVKNAAEAAAVVDKIRNYNTPAAFGSWRNEMTFVADDEDNNLHLDDAEKVSGIILQEQPQYNVSKLYLDAYPQISGSGGSRYPAVNEAINNRMNTGTLVWNYTGHGSSSRLAEEAVLEEASLDAWNNATRLPLMVTATCDFAPFDNPAYISLGEKLILREKGGAIALMTTTRAVFAASNLVLNSNYFRLAFRPGAGGKMPTLGEGAMQAKNDTYANFGDVINNRKFQLLGDPALPLAYPKWHVYTDSINGQPVSDMDTLKALGRYTIAGSVRDAAGTVRAGYNGQVQIRVFDKPVARSTRGNDPTSRIVSFFQQDRLLFKGSQTVQNGRFRYTFVVPKDIATTAGKGKLSYYVQNETEDGGGSYSQVAVSGTADRIPEDKTGPLIKAWMNDERFTDGGITNENPMLLVYLRDENGINATGNGIGHDIIAVMSDSSRFYVMNDYYETTPGDFREGRVRFPLAGLPPGKHTFIIRAWDTYNNSSTVNITFTVVPKATPVVEKVYNYPNPFRYQTRFVFSHNQQGTDLDVVIRIFAATGQYVRTIRSTINAGTGRLDGIPWDGTADSGTRLTPGIYFYQIAVKAREGKEKILGGKLILL